MFPNVPIHMFMWMFPNVPIHQQAMFSTSNPILFTNNVQMTFFRNLKSLQNLLYTMLFTIQRKRKLSTKSSFFQTKLKSRETKYSQV